MKSALSCVCLVFLASLGLVAGQSGQTEVYKPGAGVTAPVLTKEVKPKYPRDAMAAGDQGVVKLDCVVKADGTVGDVHVLDSLEPELDNAAVEALKQWTFKPGTKDGKAVAVKVEVEISFALRNRGPRLGSPEVVSFGPGVVMPRVIREVKPTYTAEAKQGGIQGIVTMDCVVLPSGTVGDVRVTTSLSPVLDAEAVKTLREWRFRPGQKDGKDVPVQVTVEMSFTLR